MQFKILSTIISTQLFFTAKLIPHLTKFIVIFITKSSTMMHTNSIYLKCILASPCLLRSEVQEDILFKSALLYDKCGKEAKLQLHSCQRQFNLGRTENPCPQENFEIYMFLEAICSLFSLKHNAHDKCIVFMSIYLQLHNNNVCM